MPQRGQQIGRKTGGRHKGVPNKFTATVKEAFELAFSELQKDRNHNLKVWAKRNPDDFYKLCAKLIPTAITGPEGGPLQIAGVVSVYMPDNGRRNDGPVLTQLPNKPLRIQPRKRSGIP